MSWSKTRDLVRVIRMPLGRQGVRRMRSRGLLEVRRRRQHVRRCVQCACSCTRQISMYCSRRIQWVGAGGGACTYMRVEILIPRLLLDSLLHVCARLHVSSACMPACSACPPACLPTRLPACSACLPACLSRLCRDSIRWLASLSVYPL